jgi:hypothetical protein
MSTVGKAVFAPKLPLTPVSTPATVINQPNVAEAKILAGGTSIGISLLADTAAELASNPIINVIPDKYRVLLSKYESKLDLIRDDLGKKALDEIRIRMNDITRVLIAIETSVKEIPKCRQIKVVGTCRIELVELLKRRFGVTYVKLEPDMTDKTRFIITFGPSIDEEIKIQSARLNELNEMKMKREADEAAERTASAAKRKRGD